MWIGVDNFIDFQVGDFLEFSEMKIPAKELAR